MKRCFNIFGVNEDTVYDSPLTLRHLKTNIVFHSKSSKCVSEIGNLFLKDIIWPIY